MSRRPASITLLTALILVAAPSIAQDSRWGAADDETVKFMTVVESKWANAACSPQPDLAPMIADDFQGTSTKGRRYGKDEAITTDPKSLSTGCKLDDIKIRFFGDSLAVAYGAESRTAQATDGTAAKRCQVWTDTWLKRAGKWQIVAAQDTVVPCVP